MSDDILCAHMIPDYGTCNKTKDHVVHQLKGISSREHLFMRPASENTRTVMLTAENIQRVSLESGRSIEDLEVFLEGSGGEIRVRYEVVNDIKE